MYIWYIYIYIYIYIVWFYIIARSWYTHQRDVVNNNNLGLQSTWSHSTCWLWRALGSRWAGNTCAWAILGAWTLCWYHLARGHISPLGGTCLLEVPGPFAVPFRRRCSWYCATKTCVSLRGKDCESSATWRWEEICSCQCEVFHPLTLVAELSSAPLAEYPERWIWRWRDARSIWWCRWNLQQSCAQSTCKPGTNIWSIKRWPHRLHEEGAAAHEHVAGWQMDWTGNSFDFRL